MRDFAGTPLIGIVVIMGGGFVVTSFASSVTEIVGTVTFGLFDTTSLYERASVLLYCLARVALLTFGRLAILMELVSGFSGQSFAMCPSFLQVKHKRSFLN